MECARPPYTPYLLEKVWVPIDVCVCEQSYNVRRAIILRGVQTQVPLARVDQGHPAEYRLLLFG